MRLPELRLVVPDGTGDLDVPSETIEVFYGSDFTQPVRVVHQNGLPYDLAGAVSGIIGLKNRDKDANPFIQREWTITGDNTAEFYFVRGDRGLIKVASYVLNVQFRDDDTGFEDTILARSRLIVKDVTADFDDPITVLPTQDPLARGPRGFRGYPTTFGIYDNAHTYEIGEGATFSSGSSTSTYIAKAQTVGNPPPDNTYWQLQVSGGGTTDIFGDRPPQTPNGTITNFTTATEYIGNTTRVFLNGVRQFMGVDYLEAIDGLSITFYVAPGTTDIIVIDYSPASALITDFFGDVPPETPNGLIETFSTAHMFLPSSTRVYLNGVRQCIGVDYLEDVGRTSITFDDPPILGDIIQIDYSPA